MSLQSLCIADAILPHMEAGDKEDAIRQLVDALAASKEITKKSAPLICKEIVERERQASTGIGHGIGVPHARSKHAKKLALAIGRVAEGLEFGAVDGERVHVIMLLVSPQEKTDDHLAAMRSIVTIARDPYQRQRLIGCASADSFLELLAELGGQKV